MKMAISFSPKPILNFNSHSISAVHFTGARPQFVPPLHLHRPSLRTRSGGGPTPPPESEPDDETGSLQLSGLAATLSRFQDTARIFFAVLFWMSLFFWSSVWEGWNSDKSDKGPPFRR